MAVSQKNTIFAPELTCLRFMCTYNISISDALIEQARPSIGDDAEMKKWMQQQMELLLVQFVASKRNQTFDDAYMSNLINLSAPSWRGVQDADAWVHELRGE